ncbi:hypothetical protein EMCRGX_G032928 [Ephydatia muelleri]
MENVSQEVDTEPRSKRPRLAPDDRKKPLGPNFQFAENFGPFVNERLAAGDLTAKQRKKFITCIARCMFAIKNYPTDEEFKLVANKTYDGENVSQEVDTEPRSKRPRLAPDDRKKPLGPNFQFAENFGPFVNEGLAAGDLTAKQRKKFITCIARCMFAIKNYPTDEEFKLVANKVYTKWPFVRAQNGQDFLSTALFNRLKAFRRANKKPTVNPTRKPNPKPLYPSSSPFQTIRIDLKTAKEHAQQAKSITFEYRKEQSQIINEVHLIRQAPSDNWTSNGSAVCDKILEIGKTEGNAEVKRILDVHYPEGQLVLRRGPAELDMDGVSSSGEIVGVKA